MRFTTVALCICLATISLALPACKSQQRALHMVERSGEHAYKIGDYATAAQEWREVVDRRPGMWDARVWLARSYLALGEPKKAREQLEVAYTIKPLNVEVLELLATAMLQSEDFDSMASQLRQVAEDTQTVSNWMRYGTFLQAAGDYDTAETALLTAARIDKGINVQPQLALASLYRAAGDDKKAITRLRYALYIEPENTAVIDALRSYGQVPGPTLAEPPLERYAADASSGS